MLSRSRFFRHLFGPRTTFDILHSDKGHSTLKFNPNDPKEVHRAKEQINDMLKLGYALFVEDENGGLHRVTGFIPSNNSYRIGDKEVPVEGKTLTASPPVAGGCPVATK